MADTPSLRSFLETERPDVLADLSATEPGLEKTAYNRQTSLVSQLLRTDDPIVRSPDEASGRTDSVDVVVHMGCHAPRTPHVIDATLDVLEALGYRCVPIGGFSNCCGILDAKAGDLETADRVDSNRFENAAAFDPDYLVTECTSCHATTAALSAGYRDPDFEVISMTELMRRHRDELAETVSDTSPVTVTLHDHHGSFDWMPAAEHDYARDVFSALPGVTVVEMAHSKGDALPCSHGYYDGEVDVDHRSRAVWREAVDAGADVLINFWHACERELAWYEPEFDAVTKNYAPFVAERLGFEYDNLAKRYRHWGREGRLDDILADARETYRANGLTNDRAREVAAAAFQPA